MRASHSTLIIYFFCLLISCVKETPDQEPDPQQADVQLTKGLLAYYPFNGNTSDESGNNNNGVLMNGSSLAYDEDGKPLSALNCNGSNQKIVVQNNGKIRFDTTMTVSFHVMPRAINRSNIIGMTENASGKGTGFVIGPA